MTPGQQPRQRGPLPARCPQDPADAAGGREAIRALFGRRHVRQVLPAPGGQPAEPDSAVAPLQEVAA